MDNGIRHFKREPSVHIKCESNPFLASIPMAPSGGPITVVKQEPSGASKTFHARFVLHRVDGYDIRAHYTESRVDFTITSDGRWHHNVNWAKVEREIFRRLHRAHFNVEPVNNSGNVVNVSVPVRPVQSAARPQTFSQTRGRQLHNEERRGKTPSSLVFSQADQTLEEVARRDTKCPVEELVEYILTLPQAARPSLLAGDGYSYFAAKGGHRADTVSAEMSSAQGLMKRVNQATAYISGVHWFSTPSLLLTVQNVSLLCQTMISTILKQYRLVLGMGF
ncbi:hypothetical protein BT67DRAFT_455220 [Trichocladium antarcticum]|uniref:Uncharacterized protein n=1 Tax=Trichocladium antarcticum TaxID=1450529 RepID=A0AAN6UN88_9PEZI|nr:hypothetical protein BT67DRAFT_455220 [Trichocladium antarcticum]